MKATFTKNIRIQTTTAYFIFEKEQERQDIQSFLQGEKFDNETINNRVKEYLQKLSILDDLGSVTPKGEKVLETGKLFVREEGKYKIWFVSGDSFIGTKILYFKRVSPQKDSTLRKLNINFEDENYFLPVGREAFSNLKLIVNNEILGANQKAENDISLNWIWEDLEKSLYTFAGQIDKNNIKSHSINSDINLNEFIKRVFSDWDYNYSRLKIRYKDLKDDDKIYFKINTLNHQYYDFEKVTFSDIPIMPYNRENALEWRDWLLEKEPQLSESFRF